MSNEAIQVAIEGAAPAGPTIEESHAALVKEGVLTEEGAGANTEVSSDPEGETGNANEVAPSSLDKFKKEDGSIDMEALQKSYLELEKKNSGAAEETNEGEEANDGEQGNTKQVSKEPTEAEKKTAAEIADKADVNLAEMSQEWLSNGELTEDHYSKLEKAGYPREMVDTYAKGLTSDVQEVAGEAMAIAGGAEEYGEMIDWAIDNLSEAEQTAFDEAVNSGNKAKILQAVRGLNAQHQLATNDGTSEPEETLDGKGKATGDVYNHMDDYMADMNDPRYETSESFRAKVMMKLGRSKI